MSSSREGVRHGDSAGPDAPAFAVSAAYRSFVLGLLANMFIGPFGAMLLGLAGVRRRAISAALFLFMNSLIAMGMGPLAVGIITDMFAAEYWNNSLRYSILTLVLVANIWAALHFYLGAIHLRGDLAAANR